MLRISRWRAYRRENRNVQCSTPKTVRGALIESGVSSGMDVGESLAKGSCRNGHLRDHLRADQRATAKDPSLEPARRCFAWSGVDGLHRRHDSGARVSLAQLRYA